MRLKAKDLIRILGAVDENSDVVFHLDDDDNDFYRVDYATVKEGQCFDDEWDETEMVLHIGIYYGGCYNPKLEDLSPEKAQKRIEESMEKHDGNINLVAEELGVSARTIYRKAAQYMNHKNN